MEHLCVSLALRGSSSAEIALCGVVARTARTHRPSGVVRAAAVRVRGGVELLPAAFVRAAGHGVQGVGGIERASRTYTLYAADDRRRQHFRPSLSLPEREGTRVPLAREPRIAHAAGTKLWSRLNNEVEAGGGGSGGDGRAGGSRYG